MGEAEIVGYICVACGVTKNMVRGDRVMRDRVDGALYELARAVRQGPFERTLYL